MKRSLVVASAFTLSLVGGMACAQDLAQTAGKNAKVVLDNDKVRVIELQMPPHARTGMHSHGDNLVVFLSGGKARQTDAAGAAKEMERKPGEVAWSGPVTHDTENVGTGTVRTLVIELKDGSK